MSAMMDVAVFGAGGLGRMVLDILRQGYRYRPVAFLDSNPALHGITVDDLPVVGDITEVATLRRAGVSGAVVAIGENHVRVALAEDLQRKELQLISAIHPLASTSPTATLSEHLIIGARVSICVHASIGPHTVLSPGCIIEHDNVIGCGAFLEPAVRLAGTVTVEEYATLGIGSCVIPGLRIGREARVEPGAVVIHNVPAGATVGGVPAMARLDAGSRFVPLKPPAAHVRSLAQAGPPAEHQTV
jgi:UDP-perosamine 4-acetyltransferase